MKKFLRLIAALITGAVILTGCKESNDPDVVVEEPDVNYWIFDDGEEVHMGSCLIYESAGQITALFSAREGLDSAPDYDNVDDCTEITFPASEIGSEIDLTQLTGEDKLISILSRLPEFGEKYGFSIDGAKETISEGSLSSKMEGDKLSITCEFTTLDDLKCSICMLCPLERIEDEERGGGFIDYTIASRDIVESGTLGCGFYCKNTWDSGWTFTYSVSKAVAYNQLGNNALIEIYVGAVELLNGEPFDVSETQYPFSVRFEYLDRSIANLVPVEINNKDREGAEGTIKFKRNSKGLYDVTFDLSFDNGDITVAGYYADALQPRNTIYEGGVGDIEILRSATLDTSSDPIVLYLSTKNGVAGPDQFDIKGEVPAVEWRYDRLMAFGGQDSSITWINGETYSRKTSQTSSVFGGNWGVFDVETIGEDKVGACKLMLFSTSNSFAYYYGKITVIE
ncbi:MAG: hypothetical protein K2K97_00870 [Muribaculaceae bacterium]|nr:hypothetical protein [Muribaculaceae bacterium]